MQTRSSLRGHALPRFLALLATAVLLALTVHTLVRAANVTGDSMRLSPEGLKRLADAQALSGWRRSGELHDALIGAESLDHVPLLVPSCPIDPRTIPIDALNGDGADPPSPQQYMSAVLVHETKRCLEIQAYLDSRARIVAERDALVRAHEIRIVNVALHFPVIHRGVAAFAAEFDGVCRALSRELADITITTTTTTQGYRSGGTEQSGLTHWGAELAAIESALKEARSNLRPYEAMLAVERALTAYGTLRGAINAVPRAQETRMPPRFSLPPRPSFRGL